MSNISNQMHLFDYPLIPELTASQHQNIRSAIRFYSTKCWHLPAPLQQKYFKSYYLLYWSGSHLAKQLQDAEGCLVHRNNLTNIPIRYRVEFHRNLNRGKILMNPDTQYALSFRIPDAEWKLDAVVMISESNQTQTKGNYHV